MTTTIDGRGVYTKSPRIIIADQIGYEEHFVLEHADLEVRSNTKTFVIRSRHESGTDVEHDSASVAIFEGAGLQFDRAVSNRVYFTGVLYDARYYADPSKIMPGMSFAELGLASNGVIEVCEDREYYHGDSGWPTGHLIMPYQPPKKRINPGLYMIILDYGSQE